MALREIIEESLERVAEHGDPAPKVYAHLFQKYPEMEALFVRDKDGGIRGNMLAQTINAIVDLAGDNGYGTNLMRAEIVNHSHLGVPPENFVAFFSVVRETFAEIAGDGWTPEFDTAWRELLQRIETSLAR